MTYADVSWASPLAPPVKPGVSNKLPAEQIAQAGAVTANLGEELATAQMADNPEV